MNASIISAKDLAASLDVWTLIDARTAEEFAAGHIPGAIHLCWEQWCDRPPEIAGPELAQPGYWGVLADPVINAFHKRLEELGEKLCGRGVYPQVIFGTGEQTEKRFEAEHRDGQQNEENVVKAETEGMEQPGGQE